MPGKIQSTADLDTMSSFLPLEATGRTSRTSAGDLFDDSYRAVATYLIVAMLPLQFLGLDIATTKVDLSNIVFLLLALSVLAGGLKRPVAPMYQLFFAIFFVVQLSLFITGGIPLARFVSGVSWIFSILIIYGWRRYLVIDARSCYVAVLAGTALLAFVILFEFLLLNNERPAGTMAEPSSAGLVLLATAAGLMISSQWMQKKSERMTLLAIVVALVYLSYVIHTTHVLSFAISVLIAAIFSRTLTIGTLAVNSVILGGIYFVASSDTHYVSRVDIGDAASNLSLLAWLQGFDQMLASLRMFPLTGAGLGATGTFAFQSQYSDFLFYSGIPDLNLLDAYSGFFRLMIEAGPIFMAAFAFAMLMRLRSFSRNVKAGLLPRTPEAQYQVFLLTFALTLIVGIMLKEPTYSRSQMVVAALLFFVVPMRVATSADGRQPEAARSIAGA